MAAILKRAAEVKHCCDKMTDAIRESMEKVIDYDMLTREYFLEINKLAYKMYFCPFCNHAFGKELVSEYFDILEKEYGIDCPDLTNFSNVPEDFWTDAWWIKRGL